MLTLPEPLALRAISDADMPMLQAIYANTRATELAQVPWSDEQKQAFIQMQFAAQHAHYQQHYTDTTFDVIEHHGEVIGRLYVARWAAEYRIVDIALLSAWCGQGIGTTVLQAMCAEADAANQPVTIHVEQFNPALRLYERLGFERVSQYSVYWLMRRPAKNEEQHARNLDT